MPFVHTEGSGATVSIATEPNEPAGLKECT